MVFSVSFLVLFTASEPVPASHARDDHVRLHATVGAEWDTNARRAVDTTIGTPSRVSLDEWVTGDAAARVVLGADGSMRLWDGNTLDGTFRFGAKRFFWEDQEDVLAHELYAADTQELSSAVSLRPSIRARLSRMRNQARDYTIVAPALAIQADFLENLSCMVFGRADSYDFREHDLSYLGPSAGVGCEFRPMPHGSIGVSAEHAYRAYQGAVMEVIERDGIKILVERCADQSHSVDCEDPAHRRDREWSVALSAAYRRKFVLGGELFARILRSNSEFENTDRFGVAVFATFGLPWSIKWNVVGGLQWSRGVSVTQSKQLAEDDENQNRVEVGLSRPILGDVELALRYSLYANEFATADTHFFRQLFYLGVQYNVEIR